MSDTGVKTVRSFCRVCTALCGILVDKADTCAIDPVTGMAHYSGLRLSVSLA